MKPILLLYPPYEGKNLLKSREPFPTGLLYLAAYLQGKNIKARVIDFGYPHTQSFVQRPTELKTGQAMYKRYGWSDFEIREWLRENLINYHSIIGVSSLMSSTWNGGYQVCKIIKEINPKSIIVMGGPHATAFPEHVANKSVADYVCIGEGEKALYNFIVGDEDENEGIISTKDIRKGKTISYERQFISDMDSLPFPDRKLLLDDRTTDEMVITFSRGCLHNCSFCGSKVIQGRKWRVKSITRAVDEIKFYVKNWGVKSFAVEDDNLCPMGRGVEWIKELCQQIIRMYEHKIIPKLKFHVPHGIPVYATANKELCSLLWEAGFRNMVFPLESTNPDVLYDMKKEFTPKFYFEATKNWSKYETPFPTEIIIGYPFVETIQSMLQTMIDIAGNGGLVWASHFRLNKGTDLYPRCIESGYAKDSFDPINTQAFAIETERFSITDLEELRQIGRGINFGIEREINVFSSKLKNIVAKDYEFVITKLPKIGDVVATGKFKFKRSQNVFTNLLLLRLGVNGKSLLSFNEDQDKIIFKGVKNSKVYSTLSKMLNKNTKSRMHSFMKEEL